MIYAELPQKNLILIKSMVVFDQKCLKIYIQSHCHQAF